MSEPENNNQVIIKYLLGLLSEAETERLDELSFTDDAFAEAIKSAETDLVDSYARGELSGTTLKRFESHYLASPLRRGKAEFAKAFQVFAERHVARTGEENAAVPQPTSKQTGSGFFSTALDLFAGPYPALKWGLAAAFLLIVGLGGWWLVNNRLRQPDQELQAKQDAAPQQREREQERQIQPKVVPPAINPETEQAHLSENESARREEELKKEQARQAQQRAAELRAAEQKRQSLPKTVSVAAFVLVPPMRGGNSLQIVSLPAQTETVAMQLQLESDDYSVYQVALTDESGNKNFWQSGKLKTKNSSVNKVLNVRFPAKLLKSKVYSLTVSGIAAHGEVEIISNYPFRTMLK